jgi:hypothetical protein
VRVRDKITMLSGSIRHNAVPSCLPLRPRLSNIPSCIVLFIFILRLSPTLISSVPPPRTSSARPELSISLPLPALLPPPPASPYTTSPY